MSDAAPSHEASAILEADKATPKHRRWFSLILAVPTPVIFVATAVLAILLLSRGGGSDGIVASVRYVHPGRVFAILIIYAASILLLGLRWHALVRMAGGAPDWTSSAEVFLTSVIINYAAPIGLAVPTRAALTVRDLKMSPGQSGAVVGWEAALDVLALTLVSVAWLALGGSAMLQTIVIDGRIFAVGAGVLVIGVLVTTVVVRLPVIRSRISPFFGRMLLSPAEHPSLALLALVITVGFWVIQIGVMASLLDLFGASTSLSGLLGIMGLPVLIGMLSPVPGGAGVREALMAAAARLEGVPAGPVVLAAVAYRLALFAVTPLVWGVVRLARASASRR